VAPPGPATAAPADRLLPAPAPLAHLLPEPALRRGTITEVPGDAALIIALAGAAGAHGYTAVVGMPSLGLLAAVNAGLDAATILLVDQPGRHWQAVVAELCRAVDLVIVDPGEPVTPTTTRRLEASLCRGQAAALTPAYWPGYGCACPPRTRTGWG
jgi:hypothetical protein